MNAMALVGMSAAGKTMDGRGRESITETIVRESLPVLSAHSDESGLAFALSANLATGKG